MTDEIHIKPWQINSIGATIALAFTVAGLFLGYANGRIGTLEAARNHDDAEMAGFKVSITRNTADLEALRQECAKRIEEISGLRTQIATLQAQSAALALAYERAVTTSRATPRYGK